MSLFIHGSLYDITIKVRAPEDDPAGTLNLGVGTAIGGLLFALERVLAVETEARMYDGQIYVCRECGSDQVEGKGRSQLNAVDWQWDDNDDDMFCASCDELTGSGCDARVCHMDPKTGICTACHPRGSDCHALDLWLAWKLRTDADDAQYQEMDEDQRAQYDAGRIARHAA